MNTAFILPLTRSRVSLDQVPVVAVANAAYRPLIESALDSQSITEPKTDRESQKAEFDNCGLDS